MLFNMFNTNWSILKDNNNNSLGGQSKIYIDFKKTKIKKEYSDNKKEQYINELNILQNLNHCNIIKLLYNNNINNSLEFPFYSKGCVFDYYYKNNIDNNNFNKLNFIKRLSNDIINAIYYLHNNGITHSDIKSENILVNNNNQFILTDFGLSINKIKKIDVFNGTIDYIAPEIWDVRYKKKKYYDCKIDIYSFGVMLLEMINEYNPFYNSKKKKYYKYYYYIDFYLNTDDIIIFDKIFNNNEWIECKYFIKKCISGYPLNRYSADQLLKEKFLLS